MGRFFIDPNFANAQMNETFVSNITAALQRLEDDHNAGPDIYSIVQLDQALPQGMRSGDVVIKLTQGELNIGVYNGVSVVYSNFGSFTGAITDAQHGTRSGGTLHNVATTSTAGFMAAVDKIKANHYIGDTSSGSPASVTEYPNDGDWGFHTDTGGGTYKLAKNKGGTIFTVTLT